MWRPASSCDLAVPPKQSYLAAVDGELEPLAGGEVHTAIIDQFNEPTSSFGKLIGLLVPIAAAGMYSRLLAFNEAIIRQRRWSKNMASYGPSTQSELLSAGHG